MQRKHRKRRNKSRIDNKSPTPNSESYSSDVLNQKLHLLKHELKPEIDKTKHNSSAEGMKWRKPAILKLQMQHWNKITSLRPHYSFKSKVNYTRSAVFLKRNLRIVLSRMKMLKNDKVCLLCFDDQWRSERKNKSPKKRLRHLEYINNNNNNDITTDNESDNSNESKSELKDNNNNNYTNNDSDIDADNETDNDSDIDNNSDTDSDSDSDMNSENESSTIISTISHVSNNYDSSNSCQTSNTDSKSISSLESYLTSKSKRNKKQIDFKKIRKKSIKTHKTKIKPKRKYRKRIKKQHPINVNINDTLPKYKRRKSTRNLGSYFVDKKRRSRRLYQLKYDNRQI